MNTPDQFELFEGIAVTANRAPKLELPIQRSKEIDMKRACQILGANPKTVTKMLENQMIRGYRHIASNAPWHIDYDSVVEYCDNLRILYCIRDARPRLAGRARHRDREILPFPLDETIYMDEARKRLDLTTVAVIHLIQAGALVGYQIIFEQMGCPWRIHAPSLERYLASLHAMATKRPSVHRSPASR